MIIYLVGMGCVGKTTTGRLLAEKLGFTFFDLDEEVQRKSQCSAGPTVFPEQ